VRLEERPVDQHVALAHLIIDGGLARVFLLRTMAHVVMQRQPLLRRGRVMLGDPRRDDLMAI
jgi:hypothetical protein